MKRLIIKIHGSVQGVCYRMYSDKKAKQMGLVGWVMNNPNGTVDIVAEGEESKLKDFLEWCNTGPDHASVDKVGVVWEDINELSFSDFNIK